MRRRSFWRSVVEATISLAHALQIKVVAEGVETAETLTALATQALFDQALAAYRADGNTAPEGLSQVLIGGAAVGEALVDDPQARGRGQ